MFEAMPSAFLPVKEALEHEQEGAKDAAEQLEQAHDRVKQLIHELFQNASKHRISLMVSLGVV